MSRPDHAPSRIVLVVALAMAALVAVPIVYLIVRASEGRGALVDLALLRLAGNSIALALTVGVIATAIALALAIVIEAVDMPLRRVATALVVLPLAIPSYVAASAYVAGMSPRGPFGALLAAMGVGPIFPEGFAWSVFVLVTSTVPLAYLPIRAALARADGDLYDAARTLGRSPLSALRVALWPTLARAVRGGGLLVVLYTLAELGTVAILRFDALPRVIYHQYLSAFDRAAASRSALVLAVLVLIVVVLASRGRRDPVGDRGRPLRLRLGRARPLALALLGIYSLLAVVVPIGSLASWLVRTTDAGHGLGGALLGSVQAAAAVVIPAIVVATIVALVAERGGRTGAALSRWVETGFALPGLVVALGISVATLRLVPSVYQGWIPYTLAMMILFVPLGVAAIRGSLANVSPRIEDAARTLGATRRQTFWRVTLPIVRPGVFAGAALVVISTIKELGASLLLLPIEKKTLAVQLWDSMEEARYGLAAAPALVLIALAGVAAFAIERREERT
ncbi:MAG: ABC transporter permease [Kofleriaceae bacterium]